MKFIIGQITRFFDTFPMSLTAFFFAWSFWNYIHFGDFMSLMFTALNVAGFVGQAIDYAKRL